MRRLPTFSHHGSRCMRSHIFHQGVRCYSKGDKLSKSEPQIAKSTRQQLKDDLKAGQPKFGMFVDSSSPLVAEQLSHSGYDWLMIDAQHSPIPHDKLAAMLAATSNGMAKALVRVAGPEDRAGIQQALDLGADGILVPSIETLEQTRFSVSCCLYPPHGIRSIFYPMRSTNASGLSDYLEKGSKEIIVGVQVETKACLDDLAAILDVPGIDLVFVGPIDLAFSMGLHLKYPMGEMFESPEFKEAIALVQSECAARGLIPGNYAFPVKNLEGLLRSGYRFLATGNDLQLLEDASAKNLKEAKKAVQAVKTLKWNPLSH